jgi:uncharacterized protein with gpF-like domain
VTNAEATALPFQEAIDFFRAKVRIPTDSWLDLQTYEHDFGFMVAGVTKGQMLTDFQDAVDKAIADGTTLQEFRKSFDDIVTKNGWSYKGARGWRSETIYSTNVRTAYQAGRYKQMTDPDVLAYRPFWRYRHGDSVRPRPLHQSWNGVTLPADHPWWQSHFTPNGWGCKCFIESLSKRDVEKEGIKVADKAPDDGTYEWTNKKTGETMEIPKGIDPGWQYAPGAKPEADRARVVRESMMGLPEPMQARIRAEVKEKTGVEI